MKCKKCKKDIDGQYIYCPFCGKKQASAKRRSTKRGNGTGSVYRREDIKGSPWVARTPAKKGREYIGAFATEREARDALEVYRVSPTTRLNITLEEIYKECLPALLDGKSKQLGDSYRAAWQKLYPLRKEKFKELRTAHYQDIIDMLKTDHPKLDNHGKPVLKDGKPIMLPPLSRSSLGDVKTLIHAIYRYAAKNDIAYRDYGEFIVLPKENSNVKPAFTDFELKAVEKSVGTVPFADCIYFLCYTGLRITEFLQLNRFKVYEKNGVCALYGGIKTDAGKNKIVPVHHKIKPILDEWMAKGGETIFCRPDKKPYTANNFRKNCFYTALEQMGIEKNENPHRLTPHATRRTFATLLSKADVREEDFIAMMGHSDYKVDIKSYIYQSAEKLQPAVEKIQ